MYHVYYEHDHSPRPLCTSALTLDGARCIAGRLRGVGYRVSVWRYANGLLEYVPDYDGAPSPQDAVYGCLLSNP